jgi:hypothetical protein
VPGALEVIMGERKEREEFRERFREHVPQETREHLKAARAEVRKSIETLFPPEYLAHRRAARREMLLAARSLIDHVLDRMQKRETA